MWKPSLPLLSLRSIISTHNWHSLIWDPQTAVLKIQPEVSSGSVSCIIHPLVLVPNGASPGLSPHARSSICDTHSGWSGAVSHAAPAPASLGQVLCAVRVLEWWVPCMAQPWIGIWKRVGGEGGGWWPMGPPHARFSACCKQGPPKTSWSRCCMQLASCYTQNGYHVQCGPGLAGAKAAGTGSSMTRGVSMDPFCPMGMAPGHSSISRQSFGARKAWHPCTDVTRWLLNFHLFSRRYSAD